MKILSGLILHSCQMVGLLLLGVLMTKMGIEMEFMHSAMTQKEIHLVK